MFNMLTDRQTDRHTNLMKHIIREDHHEEIVCQHRYFNIEGLPVSHNPRSNEDKEKIKSH